MKQTSLITVLISLLFASVTSAQIEQANLLNYSQLERKLEKSNEAIEHPRKSQKDKIWLSRAELMMDIFEINIQYIREGMTVNEAIIMFGNPEEKKTRLEDGQSVEDYIYERVILTFNDEKALIDYKETDKIHDNPLPLAKEALEKAYELDEKERRTDDIREALGRLKILFEEKAIREFSDQDFSASLNSFEEILDINKMPVMGNVVDTIIFYNAGMAASRADKYERAVKYYEKAKKYEHPDPNLYVFLESTYMALEDTASALEVLKEGFERFPDSQAILIELINYYLTKGIEDEALEYLRIAREDDPENVSYVFAEATIYDRMGETDKAVELYEKCIEMDPDFFNAYYNLGGMYYNKAVTMYEESSNILDDDEYLKARAKADSTLLKSLPYMEEAHEIRPDDIGTLETLKTLYYRLKMLDKFDEINAKLQELTKSTTEEEEVEE